MTDPIVRTVVRVIAVEVGIKMDCCDEEEAHVWVKAMIWNPRRAYLTGASPFLDAARRALGEGATLADLKGAHFYVILPVDPPPDTPEGGERLEWPSLELCPPIEEIKKQLGIED